MHVALSYLHNLSDGRVWLMLAAQVGPAMTLAAPWWLKLPETR